MSTDCLRVVGRWTLAPLDPNEDVRLGLVHGDTAELAPTSLPSRCRARPPPNVGARCLISPTAAGRAASRRELVVITDVQIEQVPAEARKVDAADAAVRDPGRPRADSCDRPKPVGSCERRSS